MPYGMSLSCRCLQQGCSSTKRTCNRKMTNWPVANKAMKAPKLFDTLNASSKNTSPTRLLIAQSMLALRRDEPAGNNMCNL